MAVIKAVSSKAGIGQALDYVTKEEKTEDKLVSGLHCEPDTVKDEMQATKELWGKTGGRTYKHFVQSYHEDEHITPEQAHRNAVELAKNTEAWKGHEVLIATHIDRGHIHSHFIVNSVNYENGHKLQWSKADLQNLKDRCNEQSRQQGLGASKVFEFYTEDYADTMSLAVFLISLAVSVYFAEPIRAVIPINLLLLLILVHIVYVLIRWYVKGCMRSRGYY